MKDRSLFGVASSDGVFGENTNGTVAYVTDWRQVTGVDNVPAWQNMQGVM